MKKRHFYKYCLIGVILLFAIIIFVSTLGAANISIVDSIRILISKIPIIGSKIDLSCIKDTSVTIIWDVRLPRIILAAFVGMGLAVVGVTFQGLFKNPMSDPHILGVSSGAGLGATIAMVTGVGVNFLGLGFTTIFAFIGAILTTVIVYNIARVGNKVPVVNLLLAGTAISSFLSAIISLMMVFTKDRLHQIIYWLMGSFSTASWKQVIILMPFAIIGFIVLLIFARDLNVIATGDENATSLGINIVKTKKILIAISSLLVAVSVSMSGIIGFVGLIIPHSVRLVVGPDHKLLLPLSALTGSIFMIICDTLARTIIAPTEIPVGAITAVFGSPYFIYLLYRSKRKVY